jgi:hypothetical protein
MLIYFEEPKIKALQALVQVIEEQLGQHGKWVDIGRASKPKTV